MRLNELNPLIMTESDDSPLRLTLQIQTKQRIVSFGNSQPLISTIDLNESSRKLHRDTPLSLGTMTMQILEAPS